MTEGTGGAAISADETGTLTYTTITGPVYDGVDIPTGTIILNAPAGFVFNTDPSNPPSLSISRLSGSGPDAVGSITSVSATEITVTITTAAGAGTEDLLSFSNIEVQPAAGTPLAAGAIYETGTATLADVVQGTSGTTWGTLSEVTGAASGLTFLQGPTDTTYGDAFSAPVTVEVVDQFGNLVDSSASIGLTIEGGTAGAALFGGSPVPAVDGVATFSNLTINMVGSGYSLEASSSPLSTADSATFAINQRPITVTAAANSKVYDGTTAATAVPTITSGSLAFSDTANFSESYASKNAGTGLELVPAGIVNDGNNGNNYDVTFVNADTGTITPAPIVISAVTDTKVYDGTTASSQAPTFQVTGLAANTLFAGDTFTTLSEPFASKDVLGAGNSTLTVSYVIDDGDGGADYSVTTETATGTITPAPIVISAVTATKVYDGTTASSQTPSFQVTGLAPNTLGGSDTFTTLSEAFGSKNVLGAGDSNLTVSYVIDDGVGGADYSVTTETASGTITPAPIVVSAVTDTKVYDGSTASSQTPTFQVTGLAANTLYGSDTITGLTQAFESKNALGSGGSTLELTGGSIDDGNGGADYSVTIHTAAGTITPAPLSITAVSTSAEAGALLPAFSVTFSGFVDGETAANLTTLPRVTTTATSTSPPGAYPITASGGSDPNYQITYVPGTLTLSLLPATVEQRQGREDQGEQAQVG